MSCDLFDVGTRIEAVSHFEISVALAAPVEPIIHQIHAGATGEVKERRVFGNTHWLIVKWDHVNRNVNVNSAQMELVKLA